MFGTPRDSPATFATHSEIAITHFIQPNMSACFCGRNPFGEVKVQAMVQAIAYGTDGWPKIPNMRRSIGAATMSKDVFVVAAPKPRARQ